MSAQTRRAIARRAKSAFPATTAQRASAASRVTTLELVYRCKNAVDHQRNEQSFTHLDPVASREISDFCDRFDVQVAGFLSIANGFCQLVDVLAGNHGYHSRNASITQRGTSTVASAIDIDAFDVPHCAQISDVLWRLVYSVRSDLPVLLHVRKSTDVSPIVARSSRAHLKGTLSTSLAALHDSSSSLAPLLVALARLDRRSRPVLLSSAPGSDRCHVQGCNEFSIDD